MRVVVPSAQRHIRAARPGRRSFGVPGLDRRAAEDRRDLECETLLKVIARMQLLREGASVMPIRDLDAFIRAAARSVVAAHYRAASPGRTLLVRRLDHHLGQMQDVRVGVGPDGRRTVRLVGTTDSDLVAGPGRDGSRAQFLIRTYLREAGGTLGHEDLVRTIASDGSMPTSAVLLTDLAASGADSDGPDVASPMPSPDHDAVAHEELDLLWAEIVQLPLHQRRALLLGMDDIALFPVSGTAGVREIAFAMEIEAGRLADWWRDLPFSDMRIAQMLGTTDVRVRNFRKCARERLERRMAASGLASPRAAGAGVR
jgi:hypothetical protein